MLLPLDKVLVIGGASSRRVFVGAALMSSFLLKEECVPCSGGRTGAN